MKHCLPFETFDDIPDNTTEEEKPFLKCAYNTSELKAYRSPWTNRYYKQGGEASFKRDLSPEEKSLRQIEHAANEVWDAYTSLYYGHEAVGSAYLKLIDKGSFEGIFGVHKRTEDAGSWDSVHLVYVDQPNEQEKTCVYKVESAVVCTVTPYNKTTVSSSLTKETTKTCNVRFSGLTGSHLENLGLIMEQVEIDFRSKMERVDMPKTLEVIESIYRTHRPSVTAQLMMGGNGNGGGPETPRMNTGMGVGAGMIGEIANMAKKKQNMAGMGGPNPFMEAMQKNLKEREAKKETKEDTFDVKDVLKRTSAHKPAPLPKPEVTTPEFLDFRKNLKKTGRK